MWRDNIKVGYKERRCEGVNWIHLAHEIVQWWAGVNTVMKFGFHKKRGNY
jgi:hypothetical protein